MTPFETYSLFHALKTHFNSDNYDFNKYKGKMNTKIEVFNKRNDKHFFVKLSKKYEYRNDMISFIVSNILYDPNVWITELVKPIADEIHTERIKKMQSLPYVFENECQLIFKDVQNPHDLLRPKQGELPELLKLYNSNKISIETLVVINILINFIDGMDKRVTDTIRYPLIRKKILKYTSLFNILNLDKYKTILKNCVYHD